MRVELVPWARAGSRFTRAFEDTAVYLVKHAPKSTVAALMRVDWHTVGRMIERVVAEHAASQPGDGLDGLTRIGIDEVAYRKGHRYLMCVSDHPFHVLKLAGDALDRVRRDAWQALREEDPERAPFIKGTRFAVRRRASNLRPGDRTVLDELAADNHDIYRGWLLVEQLRAVYQAPTAADAHALLDEWILAALTGDLDPFIRCALTIDAHRDLVVNAITERLSNARLEGMNSTVRLLSHRARGYRRLSSLLAMITLVCGRIPVALPT